ncbi:MAG: hypothetical protein ABI883_06930 [Chthoniobacterales bacterium]
MLRQKAQTVSDIVNQLAPGAAFPATEASSPDRLGVEQIDVTIVPDTLKPPWSEETPPKPRKP